MKRIWEFYENMDELVYVADMDSNELVYMNRKAREVYGISLPELTGKHCYQVLQGKEQPCDFCTNRQLQPGQFIEWRHQNPMIRKSYAVKDTMVVEDGRRYRFELAIDLSVQEQQQETIREYASNEAMLNEALRISLASTNPEESLTLLMDYLGKALHGDRFYIFEENEAGRFDNTYEWCAPGATQEKDNLQDVSREVAAIWLDRFHENQNIIIKRLEDTRETDPRMYDILLPQNIHSLVAGPLLDGGKVIGFYGIDNPPAVSIENISTLFQITGHFIVSILRRRNLVRRLEAMSYRDQLTGCGNRHSMNAYVAALQPDKSLGVLYGDVTGLKRTNDTLGHQAGDDLLLRARDCLQQVFPDYPVFRIGGDEFLVICSGISREEMEQRGVRMKAVMPDYQVVIASGSVWRPDSREDIDRLITQADQKMYDDKRAYYARTGEDRRRRTTGR